MIMLSLAPLGYYLPLVPAPQAAARRHYQPRAVVDGAALIGAATPLALVATSAAALFGAVTRRDAPAEAGEVMYGVDVPYKEAAYDPVAADAFFRKRPVATA